MLIKFKKLLIFIIETKTFRISIVLLAALITHWPTLFNRFQIAWDDQWVVLNHYSEAGLSKTNIWLILTEFYKGQYAPVNQLYYSTLFEIFGYNPFFYHSGSLLIHLCNVLLTYHLISRLLTHSKTVDDKSITLIAFFVSLLVAVHPFLLEAVAWISASKNILYAFFYLLCLNAYVCYAAKRKVGHYLLTVVWFIFSFGAKEQAVTFPVCAILIDYFLNRDFKDKKLWFEKIPLFALAVFFGIVTLYSQAADDAGALSDQEKYPLYQNLVFAAYAYTEYFVKCVLPVNISYMYPFPNPIGEPVPGWMFIYPVAVVLVIVLLRDLRKDKLILFGILFFTIHIGLALHIIPISRFAIVADRYVYISSIGVFLMIAVLLARVVKRWKSYRYAVAGCSLAYIILLSVYTYRHAKVWYNADSLKKELRQQLLKRKDINQLKQAIEKKDDGKQKK